MEAQISNLLSQNTRTKSVLIGLAIFLAGAGGIAVGLHFWTLFPNIPAINWVLAVLFGIATLCLLIWLPLARLPLRAVWPLTTIGVVYAAVGFWWGPPGIACCVVLGCVAAGIEGRLRRHRHRKP
jgi:hypothetical protein